MTRVFLVSVVFVSTLFVALFISKAMISNNGNKALVTIVYKVCNFRSLSRAFRSREDAFVYHWNLYIIAIFRLVMFRQQFFLLSIIYMNANSIVECSICLNRSAFYLSLNVRLEEDRFTSYECQVGVTLSSEFLLRC